MYMQKYFVANLPDEISFFNTKYVEENKSVVRSLLSFINNGFRYKSYHK